MDIKTLSAPDVDTRAVRFLRDRSGAFTARTIGEAIRATPPAVEAMLAPSLRLGLVVRTSAGPRETPHFHWRGTAPVPEQRPPVIGGGSTAPLSISAGEPAAVAPRIEDGEEDSAAEPPVVAHTAADARWTAGRTAAGLLVLMGPQTMTIVLPRDAVRALVACLDGEDLANLRGIS